ncbi:ATP-binding protein [Streptomyces sp. NPDC004044]
MATSVPDALVQVAGRLSPPGVDGPQVLTELRSHGGDSRIPCRWRGQGTRRLAELSANVVRHGRVPGRDFRFRLSAERATLRVEVTDSRGESVLALAEPSNDLNGRRGLLLVAALTDRWGWYPSIDGPGKTVWAVLGVRPS